MTWSYAIAIGNITNDALVAQTHHASVRDATVLLEPVGQDVTPCFFELHESARGSVYELAPIDLLRQRDDVLRDHGFILAHERRPGDTSSPGQESK